jgi:AraC-like DNA-binding protein
VEAGVPQLLRFSTEMLPVRDRMAAFREEFARQVLKMDVVDLSGGRPRVDITFLKLGPVGVGGLFTTSSDWIRDAHCVKDGVGDFQLGLLAHGSFHSRQAGHEQCLNDGPAALFDYGQPFFCGARGSGRVTNIAVPAAMLKALAPHPEDQAGQLLRPGPALHLLDGYLASLLALDEAPPPELAHSIGVHLLDLVAAAIGPSAEAAEIIAGRGLKAAQLRAVLAEIARRFADPGFAVDHIAVRLCLSRRSVQRLLEETGKSFTEHLIEHRLARAHAMLSDPRFSHLRIIDIAFAAGFGDVANFNHLFRRRFGETPSSARATGNRPTRDSQERCSPDGA